MKPVPVETGREAMDELRKAARNGRPYRSCCSIASSSIRTDSILRARSSSTPTWKIANGAAVFCGQLGDASRCREVKISGYLVKPVHQIELFESIRLAVRQSPQQNREWLITRHSLREARGARESWWLKIMK